MNSTLLTFTILAMCFLTSGAFALASLNIKGLPLEQIKEDIKPVLAKVAVDSFVAGLRRHQIRQSRESIIPDLPDPIEFEDVFYDLGDLGLAALEGNFSLSQGSIVGLSSVFDDLALRYQIPALFIFHVNASRIAFQNGTYALDALLAGIPIKGDGILEASIVEPFAEIEVAILVNLIHNNFIVTRFSIDLGFMELRIVAENLAIGGEPINWDEFNENIGPIFDAVWPEVQGDVQNLAKEILQIEIADCRVSDIILGDFSCIIPETPTDSPPTEGPTDTPPTSTEAETSTGDGRDGGGAGQLPITGLGILTFITFVSAFIL